MGNGGEEDDQCNYSRRNISDSSGNGDSERLDCYSDDCVNGALRITGQSEGYYEPYNNGGNVEISGSKDVTRMTRVKASMGRRRLY